MSFDKYYYLISSLPALFLDRSPSIDSDTFLERCRTELPEKRGLELQTVTLAPLNPPVCPAEARWQAWETYLRNLLVWRRCHHTGCDQAHQWIRPETDVFPGIIREVDEAMTAETPLERERILDRLRWRKLDDLASEHHFDFEALVLYKIRLLITEKWRDHDLESGRSALHDRTEKLLAQARDSQPEF